MGLLENGPLLIIIAAILWALDGIIRRSLFTLPPIIIVFYEHLIGLLIILPFFWKRIKKEKITPKELWLIAFVALFSSLLGTLWFTTALIKVNYISFSVVFLLQKLQPLFAITTAAIFLKEKLTRRYLIWAPIALIAAYFVTFKDGFVDLNTGEGTVEAALYAFGAAVAWGSTTTFSKMVLRRLSNTLVTGLRFLMATVMALIMVYLLGAAPALTSPDPSQFLRFLFIALSTGMVALWIYYRGLQRVQVKVSAILELTFPVLAIIIDATLYHNILAPTQYLAAIILMFSIYQLSRLQVKNAV